MVDNSICFTVGTVILAAACLFLSVGNGWKNFKTYEKRVKHVS